MRLMSFRPCRNCIRNGKNNDTLLRNSLQPLTAHCNAMSNHNFASASLAGYSTSDFADKAYLTCLIPSKTDLDLETAFSDLEQGTSILETIEQRDSLFFGTDIFPCHRADSG